METRHRNHLWAWLAGLAMALVVNPGAVPSGAAAVPTTAGTTAAAPSATPTTVAPRARLSQRSMLQPNGKLVVRFTSNARTVSVRYRHNGRTRYAALRVKDQRASITLPKGARQAKARARATTTLRGTTWIRVADRTAPAAVRGLTATQPTGSTAILLRWVNPSSKDLASITVRRAVGTKAPTSPSGGTAITLASKMAASATDGNARPGTTYTYAVFARDRAGNTTRTGQDVTVTKPTAIVASTPTLTQTQTPTQTPTPTPTPTPNPTPNPTPTPTPTLTGSDLRTASERGLAWYQANTGVPAGMTLTPSGPVTITQEGTVIDGLEVNGDITVSAKNVTIRNTLVRGRVRDTLRVSDSNLLIEHVEVDQTGRAIGATDQTHGFAVWRGATLRFVKSHGAAQGVAFYDHVTVEDSYIYGIRTGPSGSGIHAEAILSNGGGNNVIRRNWLDSTDPTNSMAISGTLCMYGDFDQVHDVVVEGNYLTGNRGYLFYPGAVSSKPYPLPNNVRVTKNVINPIGSSFGTVYPSSLDPTSTAAWTNNTRTDGTIIAPPTGNR